MRSENPKRNWPEPETTLDGLVGMWARQRGRCALTGVSLELKGPFGATLDRCNPKKHYSRGNIVIVTARANYAKGNMSVAELRTVCRQILRTTK
jgi:hypothetical protein